MVVKGAESSVEQDSWIMVLGQAMQTAEARAFQRVHGQRFSGESGGVIAMIDLLVKDCNEQPTQWTGIWPIHWQSIKIL